ncbi:hypothetical protein [Roseivirga sp.]|uniref:hypothetical protein n=1 Tax=Roseivirga sp. TaxID=1964215 RepID=UPI003B8E647E
MKRIFLLMVIAVFANHLNAQNTTYFTGTSSIDGLSSDWSNELISVDEKTKFSTAIRNDTENLYILFQTADRLAINKLLQAGMEISFKAKTKPKVNAKLEFPLETVRAQGAARGQGQGQGQRNTDEDIDREKLLKERMERQLKTKNQAKLKGFSASNGHLLLSDLDGVEMALGMDDTSETPTFGYELKISLKTLYGLDPNWDKVYNTDLNINITVNGLERPQGAGGGTAVRGGGGRGGAGGGRGGGGRGGAGGRRPNANQAQSNSGVDMFSDQTIKLNYTLSKEN